MMIKNDKTSLESATSGKDEDDLDILSESSTDDNELAFRGSSTSQGRVPYTLAPYILKRSVDESPRESVIVTNVN
jgi:hypothetical protein